MKIKTSVEVDGSLSLSQVANAAIDTNQFLVSDGGVVKYRTGTDVLSDLGIDPTVKAGVAINKGQAVYVTTADGTNIIVGKASNLTEAASSKTLGLLDATVPLNGMANVISNGLLEGLDTSTATIGDPVWLGENGNLIYGLANKPYAPKHLVYIGVVTRVNLNNGEIFINVQNGFELNEIHDVDLKTVIPVNGHVLGYNGTLWVNKTIAEWIGYTPANDADVVHIAGYETITGTKTFDTSSIYKGTLILSQTTSVVSTPGYMSLSGTIGGINLYDGSNVNRSVNLKVSNISTLRNIEFPNASGTLALTSDLHNPVTIGTANGLSLSTQVLSLGLSSSTTNGALSFTDWNTFNNKFTLPSLTSGSVLFSNGTTIAQDNANFFWDDTNNRLGIGNNIPTSNLSIGNGNSNFRIDFANERGYVGYNSTYNTIGAIYIDGGGTANKAIILNPVSTGNVGIGTATPATKLHLSYTNDSDGFTIENAARGGSFLFQTSGVGAERLVLKRNNLTILSVIGTDYTSFYTGDTTTTTEKMRITSNGNVGIGTTTVPNTLSVAMATDTTGKGISLTSLEGVEYARFGVINSTVDNTSFIGSVSNNNFAIYANNVERMRITSAGNVGIGTTTTPYLLSLSSSGAAGNSTAIGLYNTFSNVANRNWSIGLNLFEYGDFAIRTSSIQNGLPDTNRFLIAASGAATFASSITATSGYFSTNVGIGINPTEKLHVVGNGLFTGNITTNAGVTITNGGIDITSGGVTSTIVNSSSVFTLGTTSAHSVSLRTTNIARLTINSAGNTTFSGNVSINTSTSSAKLNVVGESLLNGNVFYSQPSPTALTGTNTLTIANLLTGIIEVSGGGVTSQTLPTGALTDAGILSGQLPINNAFEWSIINLAAGALTLLAGGAHTIRGGVTVAIGGSAIFKTRKTATNTFVTYRIS